MKIRLAELADLEEILPVYRAAKSYMDRTGNASQWEKGYPPREMLLDDIKSRNLYVITKQDCIHAAFFFAVGEDPTYAHIYGGSWRNDAPYGVIHRVGSDGVLHGVMGEIVAYCAAVIPNLRIDTHEDNATMQHVLGKLGFSRCGTIFLENGDPRIAFHFVP